jgi:hypothetical protein
MTVQIAQQTLSAERMTAVIGAADDFKLNHAPPFDRMDKSTKGR